MKTNAVPLAILFTSTLLFTGCSSSINLKEYLPLPVDNRDYAQMYVRGVFNWWEAEQPYRLQADGNGDFFVDVELIADGQPYDFKVADAVYSAAQHCGSLAQVGQLELNQSFTMHCGDDAFNLQFTPPQTGTYRILVESGTAPDITILAQ